MGACPDFNSREWKLLIQEMPSSSTAEMDAFKVWKENNNDYPPHILAKANENTQFNNKENEDIDPKFLEKKRLVEKSIEIITKKVAKLTNSPNKTDKFQSKINELSKILNDLKNYQTDAAIIEFIKASNRMVNGAIHWLDELENGKEELAPDSLNKIKDATEVFNILDDIKKDYVDNEKYKEELRLLDEIIGKKRQLFLRFKDIQKEILLNNLVGNTTKIKDWYKREAEKEFIKTTANKELKGKEKEAAKKDFINQYLLDNDALIQVRTRDYVRSLVTRIEDIPWATSMFINPRDVNNPHLSFALELLDKADFNINKVINAKTRELNDLYQRYIEVMGKESNPEKLYEPLLDRDKEGNLTGFYVHPDSGKKYSDIKTGKYKGTIVEELYDTIIELQKQKDSLVTNGYKLGYRIPKVNKSTLERVYTSGIVNAFKEGFLDKFRVTKSDTDIPINDTNATLEIITDESGREKRTVPVHFRGALDLKDQSYDVLTISLLDLQNTMNFKEKSEVGIILDMLKETVEDIDVVQRTANSILKIDKYSKAPAVIKGINSNLYKNIDDLIRHRVYGINIEGDPKLIKKLNTFSSFVSNLNLSLNYLSAGANLGQGVMMEWIEAVGGETGAFGRKNRINAYQEYTKDLIHITADMNNIVPSSKTNLLAEKLQLHHLWTPLNKRFIQDNIAKKIGIGGVLHSMNAVGDNHLQVILMYSVLDNIKVLDKNGNYLDKDFKPTKDRDKAIGLHEAYIKKDDKIKLHENVARTERTDGVTDNDILKISKYIQKTGRSLFGNYDSNNKAIAQRTIVGHLVYQMRGWLMPGIQKRWRGVNKAFIHSDKLTLEQLSYSSESGKFEEGQYVTTIRLIKTMISEARMLKLQTIPENWNKLTDEEKANVRKTLMEFALIFTFLFIALGLKDILDDDKEKDFGIVLTAYYSRRLFSELFTYANPKEGLRTFKSPAVSLGTVEDIIELFIQLFDPTEEYETGKRKGEYKIKYKAKNVLGVGYKGLDKDPYESLLFLEK